MLHTPEDSHPIYFTTAGGTYGVKEYKVPLLEGKGNIAPVSCFHWA